MMKKVLIVMAVVSMVSSLASAQLAGYWKFDETSGSTVLDSSGNSKNGVLYAEDSSNYPTRITGHIGNALQFNANTTGQSNLNKVLVDIGGTDALVNLGEAFSFSMWVRRDAVIVDPVIISPGILYTDAYELDMATDPNADPGIADSQDYFYCDLNSTWQKMIGAEDAAQKLLGNWYHYAVTYDGNYLRKYVNGVLVNGAAAPTSFSISATTDLSIGTNVSSSAYFTGALDDVAIWSGKYISDAEVAKLAAGTATPLTVTESNSVAPIPANYFKKETNKAWIGGAWALFWDAGFNWDASVSADNQISAWWMGGTLSMPGSHLSGSGYNGLDGTGFCKFRVRNRSDYSVPAGDVSKYGMAWIDPAWSGSEPNVAVLAAYITPDILLCQEGHGYQEYMPETYPWMYKDFFKTYARIASVNAQNAWLRIKVYTYASGQTPWSDPNVLVPFDEVYWPLGYWGDYVWHEFKHAFPKPKTGVQTPVWIEMSIMGGNANTRVYVDEFNPVSNFPNNWSLTGGYDSPPFVTVYLSGDINKDGIVNYEDVDEFGYGWLDSVTGGVLDPRDGGLLANGDFSDDRSVIGLTDDANQVMNPSGWTNSGTGNYGLWWTANRGGFGFSDWVYARTIVPMGGDISVFTTDMYSGDPYGVVEQTASATAVNGQTYYAMGYVMTYVPGMVPGTGYPKSWYGWRDTATMTISIDNVVKATFTRKLSMNKWRPLYGTYTAVPADAGKSIKISFSYDNSYTGAYAEAGNMYIGNAYLGTTIPNEWPEKRPNLLTNGGFEDLSVLDADNPPGLAAIAQSIRNSDNSGSWFVSGVPAPPSWIYEVPSGYDMTNKGGIWGSGFYGSPLPTPGMTDVSIYTSNTLVLGQVVGALASGTTYYLDAACGINSSTYLLDVNDANGANWPSPAPKLRVELWRIPAGVTDGTVIYNAISGGNPSYVKVTEANVPSTGNIAGSRAARNTPASNWQIIGTSYTATSLDTNMYVRIRGTGGASVMPEYAFSDVYLSTSKREVPSGSLAFGLSAGLQYDALGPYNCYNANQMGLDAPEADVDGNCVVNLVDYAYLAENWVVNWYNNIANTAPWK